MNGVAVATGALWLLEGGFQVVDSRMLSRGWSTLRDRWLGLGCELRLASQMLSIVLFLLSCLRSFVSGLCWGMRSRFRPQPITSLRLLYTLSQQIFVRFRSVIHWSWRCLRTEREINRIANRCIELSGFWFISDQFTQLHAKKMSETCDKFLQGPQRCLDGIVLLPTTS